MAATQDETRTPNERAKAHNRNFEKQIMRIADDLYVAIGYAASNVAMLIGDDGVIIIDTTESTGAAENVWAEFRKISALPVDTIIYTHSHRDHISGASVFAGPDTRVIAADNFSSDLVSAAQTHPTPVKGLINRTKRQFGIPLAEGTERINIGLGPADRPINGLGQGFIAPTERLAGDSNTLTICGHKLEIFKAPGETPDHLNIWMADRKTLFCGDNFYHAFPNLYAIRGTPYRDFDAWADTLDKLAARNAKILVTGHTMPVIGAADIHLRLTTYSAAISAVIEQAVAGIDAGIGFAQIAAAASLPDELMHYDWLGEYYGKFSQAVHAYCVGELGWFDGNPTNLGAIDDLTAAQQLATLAGGMDGLRMALTQAEIDTDHGFVLRLTDALHCLESGASDDVLMPLRSAALRALADLEFNAPMHNYYLTAAKELDNGVWV